jgi:hypothetical protein
MYVWILIAIGPLGRRFNVVVWPRDFAMIAFLPILFFGGTEEPAFRDIVGTVGQWQSPVCLPLPGASTGNIFRGQRCST